jgi:hypothetical protein
MHDTQLMLSVLGVDGFWTEITVQSIRHNFLVYSYPHIPAYVSLPSAPQIRPQLPVSDSTILSVVNSR